MSVEIHDKLIALLSEVDGFKTREAELRAEKQRHQEQIAQSESEVGRCNAELDEVRENQLRLRRQMDGLRDELFRAEEDSEVIAVDEAHVATEDGAAEGERHRSWKDRQKQLRSVP
jgi:chromosome segregation ATPase